MRLLALLVAAVGLALAGPARAAPRLKLQTAGSSFVVVKASLTPHGARIVVQVRGGGLRRARLVRARVGRRVWVTRLKPGVLVVLRARRARRGARFGRRLYARTKGTDQADSPIEVKDPKLPRLGVNDSADAWNHPHEFFADAHALGMTMVRMTLPWREMQPPTGAGLHAVVVAAVDAIYKRAPREASGDAVDHAAAVVGARLPVRLEEEADAELSAWLGFVRRIAARYPRRRRDWNEPGCCSIESFVPGPDLAKMIDAAYPVWHAAAAAAHASTDVIMGSWCSCGSRRCRASRR